MKVASVVPQSPSVVVASSDTESDGEASSSTIVPTPWPSAIVAPTGDVRFTRNCSSFSSSTSPLTAIEIGCVVVPAGNVRVPEAAV